MELISKVSKGSKMDQVYIPKSRQGFGIGDYVVVKPLKIKKEIENPYLYGLKEIEPLKMELVKEIFSLIDDSLESYENIFITGSFLDNGFYFNDIDVLIISENKIDEKKLKNDLENFLKIKVHLVILTGNELMKGLSRIPLYQMMLSRCVAKRRFIYHFKNEIDYKALDLIFLRNNLLPLEFDYIDGNKKYNLLRNMIAIYLFMQKKKINHSIVDRKIKKIFGNVDEIKRNIIDKKEFLMEYRGFYKEVFNMIMQGIRDGAK